MKNIARISKLGIALIILGALLAVGGLTVTHAAGGNTGIQVAVTATQAVVQETTANLASVVKTGSTSTSASASATETRTSTATIPASTPTIADTSTATATIAASTPTPEATPTATEVSINTASTVESASTNAATTASASAAVTQQDVVLPSKVVIPGFPALAQAYSLSCEYAAASAVTLFWGNQVTENTFIANVPLSPNPHLGFRGDINGSFGGVNNYGVYAEALVPVLESNGYNATVFYGGVSTLKANVAAGNPVVVWITAGKYVERTPVTRTYNGQTFTLVAGEHALVIYGYDNGGVYMMDVASGTFHYTEWSSFLTRWSYFDQMSLVITPK